jgi:7-cyano-7-deazaguanine synthase in queuosine biosynthesis
MKEKLAMKKADTHILFTGGYDSSYRLLEAVIVEKKIVQPHYIIDHRRHSRKIELKTILKILDLLKAKFPFAKELLLDPIYTKRKDIPKSELHRKQIAILKKQMHVGEQYFWLADYSQLYPNYSFELSVMKHEFIKENLSKYFLENKIGQGANCRIVDEPAIPELKAFAPFRFPILHITKKEMLERAIKNDFSDILLNCWSCHRPTIFNNPCGYCNPCKLAIENGFTKGFTARALKRNKKHLREA